MLGNAYPTYASYKAVLSNSPEEHKQWLTYWLVYTLYNVAEMGMDSIISWLPLYYEAKIACIVWLSVFGGATQIYNSFVKLFLEKYEDAIDTHAQRASEHVSGALSSLSASAVKGVRSTIATQGMGLATTAMAKLATMNAESLLSPASQQRAQARPAQD